jgi:hypothetical protein
MPGQLFVGMALLYNPVVPVFALSGSLDLLIVIASLAPFSNSVRRVETVLDTGDRDDWNRRPVAGGHTRARQRL